MPRDLLFCTCLLLLIGCSTADYLFSEDTGNNSDLDNKTNWVCDLGRTTGEHLHGGWVDKESNGNGCKSHNQIVGYIAVFVAVFFYGSNFIPVKRLDTGDGMFFQWVMCIGVWLTGLVINFARQQPPFFSPVVIGAVCWTTGNLLAVPIIKLIGMTMALTVWGIFNMLSGWLQGIVLLEQHPLCKPFNYSGVAAILLGTVIFGFVTSEGKKKETAIEESADETNPLLKPKTFTEATNQRVTFAGMRNKATVKDKEAINGDESKQQQDSDYSWVDKLGFWPRKICGFGLAVLAGLLYSFCFTFMQLMELCTDDEHDNVKAIDYTFGLFTGILLTSSFYFAVYAIYKRNKPMVYPKVILPGLVSGIMWGIATTGWIIANSELSLTVSYPLVSSGPGALSSLYGIIWFREIKGLKNILVYIAGLIFLFPGVILVGLSKCNHCGK